MGSNLGWLLKRPLYRQTCVVEVSNKSWGAHTLAGRVFFLETKNLLNHHYLPCRAPLKPAVYSPCNRPNSVQSREARWDKRLARAACSFLRCACNCDSGPGARWWRSFSQASNGPTHQQNLTVAWAAWPSQRFRWRSDRQGNVCHARDARSRSGAGRGTGGGRT